MVTCPSTVIVQYNMVGTLKTSTPPYTPVYWTVYNAPDFAGTYSGYSGQFVNGSIKISATYNVNAAQTAVNIPIGQAGGDLTGCYPNPIVDALMGNQLNLPILGPGQDQYVLTWNNFDGYIEALPATGGGPSGPAGGDLAGSYPNPTIANIQTYPITVSSPTFGDVLFWNGSQWQNDNTIYSTLLALQNQVAAMANGQGFNLALGDSPTANVLYEGTTLFQTNV